MRNTLKAEKLELVHTAVWGKASVSSLRLIIFCDINDSSRKVWVYFLKHKSDVFEVFQKMTSSSRE